MQHRRRSELEKRIEELRNKPVPHRKRVAFLVSLAVTLVVASVWATVLLPQTFESKGGQVAASSSAPFDQLMGDAEIIFEDMRQGFAEIKALSGDLFAQPSVEAGSTAEEVDEEAGEGDEVPPPPPPRNDASGVSADQVDHTDNEGNAGSSEVPSLSEPTDSGEHIDAEGDSETSAQEATQNDQIEEETATQTGENVVE